MKEIWTLEGFSKKGCPMSLCMTRWVTMVTRWVFRSGAAAGGSSQLWFTLEGGCPLGQMGWLRDCGVEKKGWLDCEGGRGWWEADSCGCGSGDMVVVVERMTASSG
ncbi:hypothetical protein OIU78_017019 [Salix suchowensis]|nr:hypothetical protein OIU78_017019 [Salix suchowensis]